MRLSKTALAVEIVVLLGLFVGVEWLSRVLTNTRENFVVGLLVGGVYLAVRLVTSATRRAAKPD